LNKTVYYLTGMGGRLSAGLGQALLGRGFEVAGRELVGEFRSLDFQNQLDLIADDLQTHFWDEGAFVIANSFGAYLLLHALTQLPPYPGSILLLSPIVGAFSNEESQMSFIPPRADKLMKLAQEGTFPTPMNCEAHVGAQDWQSNPKSVKNFFSLLGAGVTVVPDAGHALLEYYVGGLLVRWPICGW